MDEEDKVGWGALLVIEDNGVGLPRDELVCFRDELDTRRDELV